jgi:hypothetical protein
MMTTRMMARLRSANVKRRLLRGVKLGAVSQESM